MSKFVIPRQASLGAAAAENDGLFLKECFVDTGLIQQTLAIDGAPSIISGRTGSGKSAIFSRIRDTYEHVCDLKPESLSLNFLSDSWILQVLTKQEFDLGLFYQQLWRHVLVVELLKYEKGLENESKTKSFLEMFANMFKDQAQKRRAFEYLTKYGGEFWEDTELRVRHIHEMFEKTLLKEMGASFQTLKAKYNSGQTFTAAENQELVVNARKIVSSIQMQELAQIIDILDDHVFDDKKKQVILIVDDLDS